MKKNLGGHYNVGHASFFFFFFLARIVNLLDFDKLIGPGIELTKQNQEIHEPPLHPLGFKGN